MLKKVLEYLKKLNIRFETDTDGNRNLRILLKDQETNVGGKLELEQKKDAIPKFTAKVGDINDIE